MKAWAILTVAALAMAIAAADGQDGPGPATAKAKGAQSMEKSALVIYPAPKGANLSDQYKLQVNGRPVDVYIAPVYDPGYGKPFGGPYSFAYFDFAGPVEVKVTTAKPLDAVRILPASRNITPHVEGDTLTFTLERPCKLSIEPDVKNGPLLLFGNPVETVRPRPDAPGVVYFGPGLHKPGEIRLRDGQVLYIAGGAVVKGGVLAEGANIRIMGRGIIDGLDWERFKGPTNHPICLRNSRNVMIDGVILKDAWGWTFVITGSQNVRVENVKLLCARCGNNDGIGVVNSQQVTIEDCFVRTDDDCITTKGMGWPDRNKQTDGMAVTDLKVSRCVLWTDRAHIWRLGCESWAPVMRNLTFTDIDVLHRDGPWLVTVQPAEDMLMENVRFENIRVNGEGQNKLVEVFPSPTKWVQRSNTPGMIRNVVFKDVVVNGKTDGPLGLIKVCGCDEKHTVEGVTFENVVRYGRRVEKDSPEVEINEFAKDVVFK